MYYSLPLKVEHLVREEKMCISFYFKSCFFSGKEYTKINRKCNKKVKSLILILISLIRIIKCFVKGIFRNKVIYKHYKNYLRENVGAYVFCLGKSIGSILR